MLDIQPASRPVTAYKNDDIAENEARGRKRGRPGAGHETLNVSKVKSVSVNTIPTAMAWGSNHPTLTPDRIHSNTSSGGVGLDTISLGQKTPKQRRVLNSTMPDEHSSLPVTSGWPDPLPDSVLFKSYSRDQLAAIDLSVWQDQLCRATAEDLLCRNSTFSKLILRGARQEASQLRQLVAWHFGSIVNEIDVSNSTSIDTKWFATLAGECPSIARITAARCPRITDAAVRVLARKKGAALHALCVAGCENVTDDGIEILAKNCTCLRTLDLSGCPNVRDRSIFAMSALRGLEEIGLDGCAEVSDEAARHLFTSVTKLTSLSIKGCTSLTGDGLRYMHEMLVPWGMRRHHNCAQLKTFRIGSNNYVSDEFIMNLATLCPRLSIFEVDGCPLIGGDEAMGKIGGLGDLADLRLNSLQRVSDQGIRQFFSDQPKRSLTSLSLTGCPKVTDVSLKCVAKNARSLRQLRLDRNVSVTDRGLGYLSKGLSSLNLLQATHLGMVSDDGVRLIGRRCLHLTNLDVSYCVRISEASLPVLRRLHGLESLGLSGCRGMFINSGNTCYSNGDTAKTATTVLNAADFHTLRQLRLADHPDLRDAGIRSVVEKNSKTLASLDFSHCPGITAGGLTEVVKVSSVITRLDVTSCDRISARDIECIAQQATPDLRLSCATLAVDGFDGLICGGIAADTRARQRIVKLERKESLMAGTVQRAFRRYKERQIVQQDASRAQGQIMMAAMAIQVQTFDVVTCMSDVSRVSRAQFIFIDRCRSCSFGKNDFRLFLCGIIDFNIRRLYSTLLGFYLPDHATHLSISFPPHVCRVLHFAEQLSRAP